MKERDTEVAEQPLIIQEYIYSSESFKGKL